MRIDLHIGLDHCGVQRLQTCFADHRPTLASHGILYPKSLGARAHTNLWLAATDPEHVDALRMHRGIANPDQQAKMQTALLRALSAEIKENSPNRLILSSSHLAWLSSPSEVARLKALLSKVSDDIHIHVLVDAPAPLLSRVYAGQVLEGRAVPISVELEQLDPQSWWQDALAHAPKIDPIRSVFREAQGPAFWLDYLALKTLWQGAFLAENIHFHAYNETRFAQPDIPAHLANIFEIEADLAAIDVAPRAQLPSAAWIARARQINDFLLKIVAKRPRVLPRPLWRQFIAELRTDGPAIDPAMFASISDALSDNLKTLAKAHPELDLNDLQPVPTAKPWQEADTGTGFRATQYAVMFQTHIDRATEAARTAALAKKAHLNIPEITEQARKIMPPTAQKAYTQLMATPFVPHNRLGSIDEETTAPAYSHAPRPTLAPNNSGRVIVACMKNEAPYILEWIAHHRAIGIDNFLIYTNDCTDGTDEILDLLQALGIVQHRDNSNWSGNSPQQHALTKALTEPLVTSSEWIAHIDVDEFINVRCGNGTLDDFFARAPKATHVAMTWRLFGHNDIVSLQDMPVTAQFDTAAPKYCPKPHTAWGFKTLGRNMGAYEKLSCHRPNHLIDDKADQVHWVNGSGQTITRDTLKKGWRNSRSTIGYDLLQLNHYALRSAESYLIKRQRGRALHVDRSIGLGYWIRMDWSVHRDLTIKRNLVRTRALLAEMMQDADLASLHKSGFKWHQDKATELRQTPEFANLLSEALRIKLTAPERVAYALALDMET